MYSSEFRDMSTREKLQLKISNKGSCSDMNCDYCPLDGICEDPDYDIDLAKRMIAEIDDTKKIETKPLPKSGEKIITIYTSRTAEEFLKELKKDINSILDKLNTLEARLAKYDKQ